MTAPKLTEAQRVALERAERDGMVCATRLYVTRHGRGERGTTASCLVALERRGLLALYAHQDGGTAGRITEAGRKAIKK